MDIKFTAVFEHKFDTGQLLALPSILNRAWPAFRDLWPTFEIVDRTDEDVMASAYWSWQDSETDSDLSSSIHLQGELNLQGPCGFSARVSQTMAVICHGTPWEDFVQDPTVQFVMNETCRIFADIFEVDEWLQMPDCQLEPSKALDVVRWGKDLPELTRWLVNHCDSTGAESLDISQRFFLEHV